MSTVFALIFLFAQADSAAAQNACSAAIETSPPLGVQWTPYRQSGTATLPEVLKDPFAQRAFEDDGFREWLLAKAKKGDGKITDFKQLIDAEPMFPEGEKPLVPTGTSGKALKPYELSHQELENYLVRNYRLADASSARRAYFSEDERRAHHPLQAKVNRHELTARALQKIHSTWEDLLRQAPSANRTSLLPVPNKYVVAGGRFRESYYWDTLWIMKGLIESGYGETARGMLENLVFLYERHGIIPNGNRFYYLTRTQLPVLMEMIALLEKNGLLKFTPETMSSSHHGSLEARTLKVAQRYYLSIWKGTDRYKAGLGLFSYSDGAGGSLNQEAVVIRPEAGILEPRSKERHSQRVFAESGWDMSYSRFGRDPQSWLPVDLNFTLMGYTSRLAKLFEKTAQPARAAWFANEAATIRANIEKHLLDKTTGLYMDYDIVNKKRSNVVTAASFFAFYFGAYEKGLAARNTLHKLYRILKPEGDLAVHTTTKEGEGQWDGSWSWAPLNEIAFQSLRFYGLNAEAHELAFDYSLMTLTSFHQNGHTFFEKYQAHDGSIRLPEETEIYGNEEGFGWTNGTTALFLREIIGSGDLPRFENTLKKRLESSRQDASR